LLPDSESILRGSKPRGSKNGYADDFYFFGINETDAGGRSCKGDKPFRARFRFWAAVSHLTREGPKFLVIRRA
jgi:hypothetical protein